MRKLKTTDVFACMRIIKKANIREELKPVLLRVSEGEADITDIGMDGILAIVEALSEKGAEQGIYEFLSGPFEMTAQEVGDLSIPEMIEKLKELAKDNDLVGFSQSLSALIGSM